MKIIPVAASIALGLAFGTGAALADKPPPGSKPLSEIVAKLEQQGFGPFEEIDFDDDRWEIEVYRNDQKRKLHVDPKTGEITSDKEDRW